MTIDLLFRKASEGDETSEQELFRYLTDRFRLFAQLRIRNRSDSEDIVQNALLTIAAKYKDIDFHRSFTGWAYKVLENKIGDYFKVQRRRESKLEQESDQAGAADSSQLDALTRRQMLDCLRKVGKANGRFARILNLHYQGYSTDEICRKLELKQGYYYVVLSRARSMLEMCLEKGDIADHE
jgi:RNA polymerase sigma-70 factor (ECF subfamily)